jgi:hypothetical protein
VATQSRKAVACVDETEEQLAKRPLVDWIGIAEEHKAKTPLLHVVWPPDATLWLDAIKVLS